MFRIEAVLFLAINALFSLNCSDKVLAQQVQNEVANTPVAENILATSSDGRLVVVYEPSNQARVVVKKRANSQVICQLSKGKEIFIESMHFSPDDRFLIVNSDLNAYYGANRSQDPLIFLEDRGFVYSSLFDLQRCQENTEFANLFIASSRKFSSDSKFLYLDEDRVYQKGQISARGSWRFNLQTASAEKYGEKRDIEKKNYRPSLDVKLEYQVIRDRQGRVSLREKNSGKVLQIFQTQSSLVREIFLLKDRKTLITSQRNESIFWDLVTGKSTRKSNRIYQFSPDGSKVLAFSRSGAISLNEYPSFIQKCELKTLGLDEYFALRISNDGKFLAINDSGTRIPDFYDPVFFTRSRDISPRLFSLTSCQEVHEFTPSVFGRGRFSSDSRFFQGSLCRVFDEKTGIPVDEKTCIPIERWKFDLVKYEFVDPAP
jgi:WD40 repeat protein